jgi:hypothetical protein
LLLEMMNTEADAGRQRYLKAGLQLAHLPFDQLSYVCTKPLRGGRCGGGCRVVWWLG